MANTSICAELTGNVDLSCVRSFPKRYFQEVVLINVNDIDRTLSDAPDLSTTPCSYTGDLQLLCEQKGIQFKLPETGNSIKGFFGKSKTDNGFVQYLHQVQLLMVGISSDTKCKLDALDHGRYVAVLQGSDGTVEVYGWENGLSTADYTYDIVEGGGGSLIVLQSDENAQESMLPWVHGGVDANADFNSQFEAAACLP